MLALHAMAATKRLWFRPRRVQGFEGGLKMGISQKGVPYWGSPEIRIAVFWGLHEGPLILGNYQILAAQPCKAQSSSLNIQRILRGYARDVDPRLFLWGPNDLGLSS